MGAIFEILVEVLVEGCFEIISNERIDKSLRKVILFFVTTFYLALILGIIMIAIKSSMVMKAILSVISVAIVIILGRLWARLYKQKFS